MSAKATIEASLKFDVYEDDSDELIEQWIEHPIPEKYVICRIDVDGNFNYSLEDVKAIHKYLSQVIERAECKDS